MSRAETDKGAAAATGLVRRQEKDRRVQARGAHSVDTCEDARQGKGEQDPRKLSTAR